jgi:hypothetical protein
MQEEPVTDGWKEQHKPMQVTHSLDEMHQDIGREEGKQEPKRTVTKGKTAYLPTEFAQHSNCFGWSFRVETKPAERHNSSYDAPRKVRREETTNAVSQVRKRLACNAFIEVARLKEEETHEEECPSHRFLPPSGSTKLRLADGMKRHHSEDAQSTKQIKGIVTLLHPFLY